MFDLPFELTGSTGGNVRFAFDCVHAHEEENDRAQKTQRGIQQKITFHTNSMSKNGRVMRPVTDLRQKKGDGYEKYHFDRR